MLVFKFGFLVGNNSHSIYKSKKVNSSKLEEEKQIKKCMLVRFFSMIFAFDKQENAYYSRVVSNLPRVSIVMSCDFRVWAPFCCGWHAWPRSHTTSLDIVQPSRNHPRRENTDRTHLPDLWGLPRCKNLFCHNYVRSLYCFDFFVFFVLRHS